MALEKIKPRVVDATGDFTFNDVTSTGRISAGNANLSNIIGVSAIVASATQSNNIGLTGQLSVTGNVVAANIKTDHLLYSNGQPWDLTGQVTPASGSNTQVQFNNAGSFGSSANFTFDRNLNTLSVTNITANGAGLTNLTGGNVVGQVGNALIAGTVYTAAQPNITSVGTLTSLSVTGDISSGNANLGNLVIANFFSGKGNNLSNIQGSNVTGAVAYATTANSVAGANVSGQVSYAATANAVAGANVLGAVANATYATSAGTAATVTTNAQPNITSVGNLSSLTVDNGSYGNVVITQYASIFATGRGPNPRAIYQATGADGVAGIGMQAVSSGPGQIYANTSIIFTTGATIRDKDYPTGGTTRATLDSNGLSVTGNITSGNANLGNAVVANYFVGNGAYLTGVDLLTVGNADIANRIANGTSNVDTPVANGNITVSIGGTSNTVVFTSTGVNVAGYISPSTGNGTNGIIWPSNPGGGSGDVASIKYYAVTGEQTRLEINVQNDVPGASQDDIYFTSNSYVVVNNSTEATSTSSAPFQVLGGAGIAKKLYVGGNITAPNANLGNAVVANYFVGNGAYLTGVDLLTVGNADIANRIANGTSNVDTPVANGNITVSIGGTSNTVVFTSTGVNVAGTLNVGGNAIVGNLTVTGTTTTVNSTTTRVVDPIFELGGGANGAALSSDDNKDRGLLLHYYSGASTVDAFMGWDDSNVEFAFGSNVTITNEVTTFNSFGNVRASYFLGNGSQLTGVAATSATTAAKVSNGTSNVDIATSGGNVTVGVAGTANVVTVTSTGVNIAGYANLGSGNLTTTGNATAGYFIGSGNNLSNIQGANVVGQVANSLVAGTVYTAAQPNITSVGTLTSLTVGNATANSTFGNGTITASGNINFTGANVSLGAVANLHITGGTAGYFITTDGTGNLSWGSAFGGGGVTASGSNTQIQFNDAGVLGSSANLTFDKSSNTFTVDRAILFNGANLGSNVSNVYIGGGLSNQYLKTDGAGNLSWAPQTGTVASTTVDTFTGDGTTTAFTLTVAPTSINQTVVNYNGAFQLRSAYTVSGSTITFSDPPANGSTVEVTTTMFSNLSGISSTFITRSYTGTGSQTAFTVTNGCTVSSVVVTENGLLQTPTTDYTISGTTLTFTTAPGNGVKIQIRELAVVVTTVSPSITWNIASSNITMVANNGYFVDTSGGAKTMTLPTSATLGDTIRINDLAGSFATNNLTVARNGHKIQGASSDLTMNTNQKSFGLVYSNITYGWKLIEL